MATKLARVSMKLLKASSKKGMTTAQALDNHVAELETKSKECITKTELKNTVKEAVKEAIEEAKQ